MKVFNSLGSNYNLNFALRALFSNNDQSKVEMLKKYLEEKYIGKTTLVYKGREAVELGLKQAGIPKDSFVAINGFTCFAVYDAIKKAGLNIEYLDIEKGGLNFSPTELEKHLKQNPKIKAAIIQNTLGIPCEIVQIAKICKENEIVLIEDLAHSVGTKYQNNQEAGVVGDIIVLSFSQDKIIDGVSGGALISKNIPDVSLQNVSAKKQFIDKLYPILTFKIRHSYFFGIGKTLHFILKKLNLLSKPMDQSSHIQSLPAWYCDLVNFSFANLSNNLTHRREIASIYSENIDTKILTNKITDLISNSSNLRFPIFVENRKSLISYLSKHGVFVSDIWYDAPVAPSKYMQKTDYKIGSCPNAEIVAKQILNLPTHQNVCQKDAENISQLINKWLKLQ